MGILDSAMNQSTPYLFWILVLWFGQCQSKPGFLDSLKEAASKVKSELFDGCKDKNDINWEQNQCAMVFDEENCSDDGLKISKGKTSFTRLQSNRTLASWHDEIDAIITKKGCLLTGFKKSDCTGDQSVYGDLSEDKVFADLEDFEDKIECIKCKC